MREKDEFCLSDWAAQNNPGWRVRWCPDYLNVVLMVNQDNPDEWKLIWCSVDPGIILNDDNCFIHTSDKPIKCSKRLVNEDDCPRILRQCYKDVKKGNPPPRHINRDATYISKEEASAIEHEFFLKCVAPYISSHTVYSVHASGTALCKRLGIEPFAEIFVNHYESSTYQNDDTVHVTPLSVGDPTAPVLVIDDMLSSGHTAAAILQAFEEEGIEKVRFVTLYDVVASREDDTVDAAVETFLPVSNNYWLYGRGMDLYKECSRNCWHVRGADKQFGWETTLDIEELFNYFEQDPVKAV